MPKPLKYAVSQSPVGWRHDPDNPANSDAFVPLEQRSPNAQARWWDKVNNRKPNEGTGLFDDPGLTRQLDLHVG